MAASWIEIANSALVKLGAKTIISLDDGSKEADLCKLRLDPCRDTVLRMHPWNCAMRRVQLAPLVTPPPFDWSHQFQLPSDCLRVIEVCGHERYLIEGRRILADATLLDIIYIYRITDPVEIDALLGEAIACWLAYDIGYALVQSPQAREYARAQFDQIIRTAKHTDAIENSQATLNMPHLERVRLKAS